MSNGTGPVFMRCVVLEYSCFSCNHVTLDDENVMLSLLIMNQEQQEKRLYLKNYTTHEHKTCTVCW